MNKKRIVIYTSKYGSTEKYAKWLAEALKCPAKKQKDAGAPDLEAYDTVLYGGGIYAGRIEGFQKFLKSLGSGKNKKLILFLVGIKDTVEMDAYQKVADQNIPQEWRKVFQIFALHGDQLFSKMNTVHKMMMRLMHSMIKKKPETEQTEEDKQFLESFGKDIVCSSREQIEPILSYLSEK